MMRGVRFIVGLCLLPLCAVAAVTLWRLLMALPQRGPHGLTPEAVALAAGSGLWVLVYLTLPRPARSYVLAHELTHVLWAALFGIRVYDVRVGDEAGSVSLEKTNVLINLAPYFFPFYTVLVIAAYYLLAIVWDVRAYSLYWLGLVGFTWGFHATFTVASLCQHQTDTRDSGYVFSYATIVLLNLVGICLWVVMVSPVTLEDAIRVGSDTVRTGVDACIASEWVSRWWRRARGG